MAQTRDEVFEKVFQRRMEVAKEIMIVDQYGFDGSPGDQSGVKWFLKMIQKTNPKLSNLVLVGAYNKSKERQSPLSMKDYKQELFLKMKKLMGQYDWGEGMRRYLSVADPDPDIHQAHIFIDRSYRYTWDYRFRLFADNKIKSDQEIYFSCSFGDTAALDLKWYKKFKSIATLV